MLREKYKRKRKNKNKNKNANKVIRKKMSNEEGETREITAVDHINKDSMGKKWK